MKIALLDQNTINKIAAGEVIERPSAVVKELVENAIDAKATAITIEIKDGGTTLIRVTDNGIGIPAEDIRLAFKRHSTSKIQTAEDLIHVSSLGFRGEALASIAAVSQVELITKTSDELTGIRYAIEGGEEKAREEVGCPEGTTFIVRNLFYNTPARRKFLKTAMTEASYVNDYVERLALSHPDISFKFITNQKIKLHTSGNNNVKEIIYHVYGKDIAKEQIPIQHETDILKMHGYTGTAVLSRGNRNYMNYFINGRYIKSTIVNKAIEEAYKPYMMAHKYPFTVLFLEIPSENIDVNVHPSKMEIRFSNQEEIYRTICQIISSALNKKEMIPEVKLEQKKKKETLTLPQNIPEPFEKKRMEQLTNVIPSLDEIIAEKRPVYNNRNDSPQQQIPVFTPPASKPVISDEQPFQKEQPPVLQENRIAVQGTLFEEKIISSTARQEYQFIGQVFSTYWMIQYKEKLCIIDQHAAHEKILYEKLMKSLHNREIYSQKMEPPVILTLSMREEQVVKEKKTILEQLGYEIEEFGGREYSVRAVPANLVSVGHKELLLEVIESLIDEKVEQDPEILLEKAASMSCKAAVKGKHSLSIEEAKKMIDELLELDNPYHCPHGRPTIVTMSQYELEKKFRRVL